MQSSVAREMSSPWVVALSGQLALAVAIGIGRFAFTPILPMMADDAGLSLAQGGWLASANYFGYFAGALASMTGRVGQRLAIRIGLAAIAAATLDMAFATGMGAWLMLRALPGFASAWVLVNVSTWSLDHLGKADRGNLVGVVYAGVGVGIVFTGLTCMALAQARLGSVDAWLALGASAVVATALLWPIAGDDSANVAGAPVARISPRDVPEFWRLVFCHGAFGFGYIIPATFLPMMAKGIIDDPLWFGWAWPVFGAAAAISTLLASRLSAVVSHRGVWIWGNLAMAAGVLVPLVVPGLGGITVAALLVGGTFMVNTMVGFQEARRVAGPKAKYLMAAMTASFAAGQIAGPLLVSVFSGTNGFTAALVTAALPLFTAAYFLNIKKTERP
jgi:predicted MFS family arabinose efflux permease